MKITDNFEIAANELLENYSKIYNAEIQCSDLANIMARSQSKWAEYSISTLCKSHVNFDFIETTSMKGLGKHMIPFSEILRIIHLCENHIPFDSRIKIYTFEKRVDIQIVHYLKISFNNPYEEIHDENYLVNKRLFSEKTTDKLCEVLKNIDLSLFKGSSIYF